MSTVVLDMQTMITAQSKMMDGFMKQQSEQLKQQQAIMTQQTSSLINLVLRMSHIFGNTEHKVSSS
jgi:hypothetical protein